VRCGVAERLPTGGKTLANSPGIVHKFLSQCGQAGDRGLPASVALAETDNKRPMNKIVLVVLAILLPPLAVYLKTKSGKDTVINLILCFLFWLPGVIHALYLCLK